MAGEWHRFDDYELTARVFEWCTQGKEGVLNVRTEDGERSLHLGSGTVQFATSTHGEDKLHRILVRLGRLTQEQYDEAAPNFNQEVSVGRNLVDFGLISQKELVEGARRQVFQVFSGALRTPSGEWSFDEVPLAEQGIKIPLSFRADLARALMEFEDRSWIASRLDDDFTLVAQKRASLDLKALEAIPDLHKILDQLDGKRDINQIVFESDVEEFRILKMLHMLLFFDQIELQPGQSLEDEDVRNELSGAIEASEKLTSMVTGADETVEMPLEQALEAAETTMDLSDELLPEDEAEAFGRAAAARDAASAMEEARLYRDGDDAVLGDGPNHAYDTPIEDVDEGLRESSHQGKGVRLRVLGALGFLGHRNFRFLLYGAVAVAAGAWLFFQYDWHQLPALPESDESLTVEEAAAVFTDSEGESRESQPMTQDIPEGETSSDIAETATNEALTGTDSPPPTTEGLPGVSEEPETRTLEIEEAEAASTAETTGSRVFFEPDRSPVAEGWEPYAKTENRGPSESPSNPNAMDPRVKEMERAAEKDEKPTPPASVPAAASDEDPMRLLDSGRYPEAAQAWANEMQSRRSEWTIGLELACQNSTISSALVTLYQRDPFFLLPKRYQGRDCFWLCWGLFPDETAARAALESVPAEFKGNTSPPRPRLIGTLMP